MHELDRQLAGLATLPTPARLAAIDAAIWDGIGRTRSDHRTIGRVSCVAVTFALMTGLAAGLQGEANAAPGLVDASLAPSSLLTATL